MTADTAQLSAYLIAILFFGPYYYLLNLKQMEISKLCHVRVFFLLWLAFFTFEFYFLGPFSFIEMSHEGNLNPAIDYYLTHHHDGGRFSHQFGGGQDLFILLPGMQYFNPDAILHSLFPFWVVILIHKLYFATLGFFGAYLIARHHAPNRRAIAVAVATIFPVTHEYLLNYSTNWGPGYAAIPFAVYACTIATNKIGFWPIAMVAAVILSAADPIHIFPPLAIAVVGYVIFNPRVILKRTALAFGIYVILSIVVWHEFIYANATLLSETARLIKGGAEARDPFLAFINGTKILAAMTLPFALFLAGLLILGISRSKLAVRSGVILVLLVVSYAFAKSFPWESFGLMAISKLSHYYMLLSILTLFVPVLAEAVSKIDESPTVFPKLRKFIRFDICIIALALSVLTWNKALNFSQLAWFGGQSSFFGFEKLSEKSWQSKEAFRVVTLFDRPPANNIAGMYNIDSFDGQPSLYLKRWVKYWDHVQKAQNVVQRTRVGLNWALWNGHEYDINSQIRLNLLAIANVRYLFSALRLKSDNLKLIFSPDKLETALVRPVDFASKLDFLQFRIRRIFDPGELYIYELSNVLPRVFSANSTNIINNDLSFSQVLSHVSDSALSRRVTVSERYRKYISLKGPVIINSYSKMADGFDMSVTSPEGGLVVINNSYLPFWKATIDGVPAQIFPVNAIHMGVSVPIGAKSIRIRYQLKWSHLSGQYSGFAKVYRV
jgi:hypothetical protein